MAKSNLTKFLTGVAVISAGVALGLAVYNKLDHIKRELEDDEFEDDEFFDDDDIEDDVEDSSYVIINADVDVCEDDADACEECEEEVSEEADAPSEAE